MKKHKETIAILENKDIRPSQIRIKIYEFISKDKIHPTVDDIYNTLKESIPTLSKTTVYNTLNLFKEKNLIKSLNLNDNTMRYELNRSLHAHFKCNNCTAIYDIPATLKLNMPDDLKDATIEGENIIVTGTCPDCLKNNK